MKRLPECVFTEAGQQANKLTARHTTTSGRGFSKYNASKGQSLLLIIYTNIIFILVIYTLILYLY